MVSEGSEKESEAKVPFTLEQIGLYKHLVGSMNKSVKTL